MGYWDPNDGDPRLVKANPAYPPFPLADSDSWLILGEIQKVVEARVPKMRR